MNCGFCGKAFEEDRSQPACKTCPLGSDCGLILGPHCGYENPSTPAWISFIKKRLGRGPAGERTRASRSRTRRVLPVLDAHGTEEHR